MLTFVLATAIQQICMAKALMLIRELEFYNRSMLHLEQPMQLKVCPLQILAWTHANPQQADLAENLNFMFGIAVSTDDEPSLRTTACHALFACKITSSFL
jgi:hypothetical protein